MTQTDTTVEMTREEAIAEIDRISRRVLGMSAAEFAVAYRERRIDTLTRVAEAIGILNLLPDSDPIFEAK
jgi:hypothetical protein